MNINKLALVLLLLPSTGFTHGSSYCKYKTPLVPYACWSKQDQEDLVITCVSHSGEITTGRAIRYYSKQAIAEREERLRKWDLK